MPSNFFLRKKAKSGPTKRKKDEAEVFSKKKKSEKIKPNQEEISSDEDDSGHDAGYPDESSSEEENEQEKKLRLAKKYIAKIEEEEREKNSLDDTREAVAQRLKEEALEEAGRLQKKKAHEYENVVPETEAIFRGHKLSITALAVSSSEKFFISAAKDCNIIKWSIEEKKKIKVIPYVKKGTEETMPGHTGQILALALSSDDKFLASGCSSKIINIWNPETMEHLKTFKGHRGAITGLAFQRNSHQLISASSDRSLKLWNLDEMGYVETLFGHQDEVNGIDCFVGGNAVTCGGRDNTVRLWKLAEESQLVFQGHGASIDCVAVSSFQSFVSGGDDGSLLLWGTQKKKPMFKVALAHGEDEESEVSNWIVSVTTLQNTDLVASGNIWIFFPL
ncbi:U3 small nucleolar RNA-interacting protein 2 [Araneus ventricosus]|uniref:U3 small nucleolar RNA-interacting protein 2 n=1 Tax=Araneus ventricosus TaxID=182803 RepID=A0A4Y2PBC3_ARAVE|nr:U3 small nucleolar RNA-interacting protein 2 [Araneus ventricosus]